MQTLKTPASQSSLERDAALEYLFLGDLMDLLDDPSGPETCRWVLMLLDGLLRLLPREFHREEDGGYLQEVLDEYPSWERQVRDLHSQHFQLHSRLAELRSQVAALPTQDEMSSQIRLELYEWIEQVQDHNRQETELLQTAINLEVGVGD